MFENIKEIIRIFLEQKKDNQYDSYREKKIQIRVTIDEKYMIEQLAKLQGRDTSNFIRWLILTKYLDDFIKS
jgi:hypothetical protein